MRPSLLYIAGIVTRILPETRFFGFKRLLLQLAGARLGKGVRVCSSAGVFGGGCLEVGDDTWIGHHVLLCVGSKVTIGKGVDVGPRVYIGTGTHKIDAYGPRAAGFGINIDVVIEDGVWLGVGSVVLPGATVGRNSVVAAGSVVAESIPPRVMVAGVPARVIRSL